MIWKILFFLPAFVFIFWEIYKFQNTAEVADKIKAGENQQRFHALGGTKPSFESIPGLSTIVFFELLYTAWALIGIFSSQWVMFVLLFVISLIPKPFIWLKKADDLISIALLVFVILNAFHLHINLFAELKSWIYGY